MATINVKAVVGRFSAAFTARRKTIDACLAAIKRYFTDIKPKATKIGVETSCAEITNFLPGVLVEFNTLQRKHAELKEECDNCMFYKPEDAAAGGSRTTLSHWLNFIAQHIEHHVKLYNNQSAVRAYESALKRKDAIIEGINAAVTMNKEFEKTIKAFLHSARFSELTLATNSLVAIGPSEVRGTKQQKRDFFKQIDPHLVDKLRHERRLDKTFVTRGGDGDASERSGAAEQTEDGDVFEAVVEKQETEVDEDVVLNGNEEDEDEDDEDDEEEGEQNGANGEHASADDEEEEEEEEDLSSNQRELQEVEANAEMRAGRMLRKRKYKVIDLDRYGEMIAESAAVAAAAAADTHQEVDSAAALPRQVATQQNGVKKKKKVVHTNEEAEGSAMSASGSDSSIARMLARKKAETVAKQSKSVQQPPKGKS